MQFQDYKIADIKNNTQIVERLSQVEEDLSKDMGCKVVLIAYQEADTTKS